MSLLRLSIFFDVQPPNKLATHFPSVFFFEFGVIGSLKKMTCIPNFQMKIIQVWKVNKYEMFVERKVKLNTGLPFKGDNGRRLISLLHKKWNLYSS